MDVSRLVCWQSGERKSATPDGPRVHRQPSVMVNIAQYDSYCPATGCLPPGTVAIEAITKIFSFIYGDCMLDGQLLYVM